MRIGIIDTGVDRNHKRLKNIYIEQYSFNSVSEESIKKGDCQDINGHGTGIAGIISGHNKTFKLISVNVFNEEKKIIEAKLISSAIRYLVNKCDVKIINISLGIQSEHYPEDLLKAVREARQKDVLIIASIYYDQDLTCYPANFEEVISVASGYVKHKKAFKLLEKGSKANIIAKGGFQRIAVPSNAFKFGVGTSYATAHFTGIVANAYIKKQWSSLKNLQEYLVNASDDNLLSFIKRDKNLTMNNNNTEEKSRPRIVEKHLIETWFKTNKNQKIALFPADEKEIESVLKNEDLVTLNIGLAIGYPKALKKNTSYSVVRFQLTDEHFKLFDTIVVGYLTDQLDDVNVVFGFKLLEACILNNKNIVTWDKQTYTVINELKKKYTDYSGITKLIGVDDKLKIKIFESTDTRFKDTIPSLCVIGTTRKQGKFTVQLKIKEILERHGLNTSFISTEPQGIFFDADFIFPMGFKSTVDIKLEDWVHVLNGVRNNIVETKAPDIFITGSQSGILPRHPSYSSLPPKSLLYVKAIYPDAIVCSISPDDDVDFIKKTVDTTLAFTNAKVLFYCLTPYINAVTTDDVLGTKISTVKLDKEAYSQKMNFFKEKLAAEVIDVTDAKNESIIAEKIFNHYSK